MGAVNRRADSEFAAVKALCSTGLSDYGVARETGVPRSTVRGWRHLAERERSWIPANPDWRPPHPERYAYLLGVYLGDGHIVVAGQSAFIRISLDSVYPAIVDEVAASLELTFSPAAARRYQRATDRSEILQLSSAALPIAFPQHGPGQKHLRTIELATWQRLIAERHPRALLRGLIHSDGARCINRFDTHLPSGRVAHYEYPRYFFSNLSADIRRIFCDSCEPLGIRWTQSNPRNISVSHRDSVACLDAFVGPKS